MESCFRFRDLPRLALIFRFRISELTDLSFAIPQRKGTNLRMYEIFTIPGQCSRYCATTILLNTRCLFTFPIVVLQQTVNARETNYEPQSAIVEILSVLSLMLRSRYTGQKKEIDMKHYFLASTSYCLPVALLLLRRSSWHDLLLCFFRYQAIVFFSSPNYLPARPQHCCILFSCF